MPEMRVAKSRLEGPGWVVLVLMVCFLKFWAATFLLPVVVSWRTLQFGSQETEGFESALQETVGRDNPSSSLLSYRKLGPYSEQASESRRSLPWVCLASFQTSAPTPRGCSAAHFLLEPNIM